MSHHRRLLIALSCVVSVALIAGRRAAADVAEAPPRPNIVLIMCDDLGFSDLGCYGGEIQTPHLDRLAGEGLRFTQFYNCAVCVTTRAALLTGLYPRQAAGPRLKESMATVAELLRDAGYQTALIGKWHLGAQPPLRPIDRGFDEYYGLLSGCSNYFNPAQPDPVFYGGQRRPFAYNDQPVTEFPAGFYATDAYTEQAIRTLKQFASRKKPFFLHLCYTAPHFPLHAKPADIAKYQGKYSEGYFALRQRRYRRQLELGIIDRGWELSPVDHKRGPFRYDYEIARWEDIENPAREKRRMEVYAGMVDCLDQGVGRLVRAIDEVGGRGQTIVLFLSDNGGCASLPSDLVGHRQYNQELPGGADTYDFCGPGWGWAQCTPFRRYKTWTYEGGIATPMIARWPGVIRPDTLTSAVGHVIDILPTCLELAGTTYPSTRDGRTLIPVEGQSLGAVLRGETDTGHDRLFWELYGNRAVRDGKWKLVRGADAADWELFDMHSDRTETNNLAGEHPEVVARLAAMWDEWSSGINEE